MKNDNLLSILRILLAERPEYSALQIPDNIEEQRILMRSLMNLRPTLPVSTEFLTMQDNELQKQTKQKGIVNWEEIPPCNSDTRLRLWQGDITRLKIDAIVNAANSTLLGCFIPTHRCIDNAIHSAAGVQLRLACYQIINGQNHPEPTGQAKITEGYNLPASYVIHTVGPIVSNAKPTKLQELKLAESYRSCLAIANLHGLQSIAFCCISTGEFGFPQQKAAEIAVNTVKDYLDKTTPSNIKTVVFNVFKDEDLSIYRTVLS